MFVAKAALKFFDETGSVIAAVAKDLSGAAISWTNDAIKQTAKDIENGVLDAGDELKNWAHDGGGFLNCGSEKVSSLTDNMIKQNGREGESISSKYVCYILAS